MPVDNRYTGVGYEPPFETPADKDFMESENAALRRERDDLATELTRVNKICNGLRAENEIERMRLAACGVVAMANTPESAAKTRIPKDNPYYSASLGDVEAAVDREMKLRAEVESLNSSLDIAVEANKGLHGQSQTLKKIWLDVVAERDSLRAEVEDYRKRLNPSFDYVDGQPIAVAEDEIDRLRDEVENNNRDKIEYAKIISQLNIELQHQKDRVESWKQDYDKISEQLQIVQDERARSFAMLQGKVAKCGLTEYQPEVDLEIGFRIDAIKADLAAAMKVLRSVLEEEHFDHCNAIKGPWPETWLEEEDCDCIIKDVRALLALLEVKP